jgi:hypothetical protein
MNPIEALLGFLHLVRDVLKPAESLSPGMRIEEEPQ